VLNRPIAVRLLHVKAGLHAITLFMVASGNFSPSERVCGRVRVHAYRLRLLVA
jgi:hypothetical protein